MKNKVKCIHNLRHINIILIVTTLLISYPLSADLKDVVNELSCEDKVKQNEKLLVEYEVELNQVNKQLEEEQKVRKELQDQLDALTELEENINERETLNNNKH